METCTNYVCIQKKKYMPNCSYWPPGGCKYKDMRVGGQEEGEEAKANL